jgi:hypothetical protein
MRARQHMERGVFERVITSRFENQGKVKYHSFIIA